MRTLSKSASTMVAFFAFLHYLHSGFHRNELLEPHEISLSLVLVTGLFVPVAVHEISQKNQSFQSCTGRQFIATWPFTLVTHSHHTLLPSQSVVATEPLVTPFKPVTNPTNEYQVCNCILFCQTRVLRLRCCYTYQPRGESCVQLQLLWLYCTSGYTTIKWRTGWRGAFINKMHR